MCTSFSSIPSVCFSLRQYLLVSCRGNIVYWTCRATPSSASSWPASIPSPSSSGRAASTTSCESLSAAFEPLLLKRNVVCCNAGCVCARACPSLQGNEQAFDGGAGEEDLRQSRQTGAGVHGILHRCVTVFSVAAFLNWRVATQTWVTALCSFFLRKKKKIGWTYILQDTRFSAILIIWPSETFKHLVLEVYSPLPPGGYLHHNDLWTTSILQIEDAFKRLGLMSVAIMRGLHPIIGP